MVDNILQHIPEKIQRKISINHSTKCWNWIGANKFGYGQIRINKRTRYVTHVILDIFNIKRPTPKHFALHKCDNPSCINPDHLFWGEQKENVKDMINKKRNNFSGLEKGWTRQTKKSFFYKNCCWSNDRKKFRNSITFTNGTKKIYLGQTESREEGMRLINDYLIKNHIKNAQ